MYKLNRRVTVKRYTTSQNEIGGLVAVLTGSWTKWADVFDRTGTMQKQYDQSQWSVDNIMVMRYEEDRALRSNDVLEYESENYRIDNIQIRQEGHKYWEYVQVTKIDEDINSEAPMDTGNIKVFNYTATGGEYEFIEPLLIGKSVFNVFKDGVQYVIITTGPIDGKVCDYEDSTGTFTFGTLFEPGEIATILYY